MSDYNYIITLPKGVGINMEKMDYKLESKKYSWLVTIVNYPLYTTKPINYILSYRKQREIDYYNKVKLFMKQMKKWP